MGYIKLLWVFHLIIKRNKHKPLAVIDATVLIEQLYWANDGAASKE